MIRKYAIYFCRMHTAYIPFKNSQIHYSYSGNGNKIVVCFHGYGESEESFHFLAKHLPQSRQLIAIDLPYHGKTEWKDGPNFTTDDLVKILHDIFLIRNIPDASFSLLGFSMGGRMSLAVLQAIPQRIEKMVLLAPDGLKVNFWYWLATQTRAGNYLFHFTMNYPGWLFTILQAGHGLRLLNLSVYKFIRHYVHDRSLRRQLYLRWTGMRKIKPGLPDIKKKIVQHQIPVHLVYGEYDRIIRHERGQKFRKGIEAYCSLQVLKTGHQLLQEKNAALIAGLL